MKAMIVGAGIGGLTAAIALRRAGVETTVFERAGELREVGARLLLAVNAVRALDELGLSEKVRRLPTPASAARILSRRGHERFPVVGRRRMTALLSAFVAALLLPKGWSRNSMT